MYGWFAGGKVLPPNEFRLTDHRPIRHCEHSANSRISKNGRKYTALGVAIISGRNQQSFHYNLVAFGKQGHFAKSFQAGTRIKLVV